MRYTFTILVLLVSLATSKAQQADTFMLHDVVSKFVTNVYKRVVWLDKHDRLYHVSDYFEDGRIQMEATYRKFDKNVKEEYQCKSIKIRAMFLILISLTCPTIMQPARSQIGR